MRRSLAYQQQQYYAESGQAQRQSHAYYEASWSSNNNNYQKQLQVPGMYMKPSALAMDSDEFSMSKQNQYGRLGGNYGMFQENMPGGSGGGGHGLIGNNYVQGSGQISPYGGTPTNNYSPPPHQFSNGGANRFNYGGQHDLYASEDRQYGAYGEEHVGAGTGKMDEMRYQLQNLGTGDSYYVNPYEGFNNTQPRGGHNVEWTGGVPNIGPVYATRKSRYEYYGYIG